MFSRRITNTYTKKKSNPRKKNPKLLTTEQKKKPK